MREGHMLKTLSICAVLSFLLVSSAMAQSRVCAADIKQACANIEPGGGRIAACVKEKLKTFLTLARQGWPRSRQLQNNAARR